LQLGTLRDALNSPLLAESRAEQDARLEIIDMLPALNRKLVGETQVVRDMAFGVSLDCALSVSTCSFS